MVVLPTWQEHGSPELLSLGISNKGKGGKVKLTLYIPIEIMLLRATQFE